VNLFADLETDRERDSHAEHRGIVEAVVARDKDRALDLIDRYFAASQPMRDTIIETLKRNEQSHSRRRRNSARTAQDTPRPRGRLFEAAE
jgi:GntR family carbon starvation induced transcriptional regulator